ncbi:MAG: hypothetical protein JJ936_14140, partial [Psychroserpens sp.]|nr:hypothetical protein [Psychroserpens sp.]
MNELKKHINPFESTAGAMSFLKPKVMILVLAIISVLVFIIAKTEILGLATIVGLMIALAVASKIFNKPKSGIYLLIVMGFFVTG